MGNRGVTWSVQGEMGRVWSVFMLDACKTAQRLYRLSLAAMEDNRGWAKGFRINIGQGAGGKCVAQFDTDQCPSFFAPYDQLTRL